MTDDVLPVRQAFENSPYYSTKYTSYFPVYQELFEKFVGKEITFVEVGVLNGGSLFMWREFFGPQARIVGVEFNPEAVRWREHGFEIFIGDQSDETFWADLFGELGQVDVVLDDGGHENLQQITTVMSSIDNVRDGGLIVVEDTHTNYWRRFGNPSSMSFVSFAKHVADKINARSPTLRMATGKAGRSIASVRFFESIVAFYVDRRLCQEPTGVTNGGESVNAENFFIHDRPVLRALTRAGSRVRRRLKLDESALGQRVSYRVSDGVEGLAARRQALRGRKFFE